MDPKNLLKPYFEAFVTFEPFGIFDAVFHCCAQDQPYHFIYEALSTLGSL